MSDVKELNMEKQVYGTDNMDTVISDLKKNKIIYASIGILIVTIVIFSGWYFLKKMKIGITNYSIESVKTGSIAKNITFDGEIVNSGKFYIKSKLSGEVMKVTVDRGEKVSTGDLLALISESEMNKELNELSSELRQEQNSLVDAKLQRELNIVNYQRDRELKTQHVKFLKDDLRVKKDLFDNGAISKRDYELLNRDVNKSEKEIEFLEKSFTINDQIKTNEIESIKNKIGDLKNKIKMNKEKLNGHEIRTNYDGIIKEINIEEGKYVSENENCFLIHKEDDYKLEIHIPEKELNMISSGQSVTINFMDGAEYSGSINHISNIVEEDKNSFHYIAAYIKLNKKPKTNFISGLKFTAKIALDENQDVLVINRDLVFKEKGSYFVYLLSQTSNSASKVKIMPGNQNEDQIEVVSGLKMNDRIIKTDFEKVRHSQSILLKSK